MNVINLVRQIEQQHTGDERDKLIAEAVSVEPETARWMTPKSEEN